MNRRQWNIFFLKNRSAACLHRESSQRTEKIVTIPRLFSEKSKEKRVEIWYDRKQERTKCKPIIRNG